MGGNKWFPLESFEGHYDGKGHTISNLDIEGVYDGTDTYSAFAAVTAPEAYIGNTIFENAHVETPSDPSSGAMYTGTVAGINGGTIEYCEVRSGMIVTNADVSSPVAAGGIAGINNGTIGFSSNSAALASIGGSLSSVGGIAGQNNGVIANSYAAGAISMQNAGSGSASGSFAGSGEGTIANCVYLSGMGAVQAQALEATTEQMAGASTGLSVLNVLNDSPSGPAWVFKPSSGFAFPVIDKDRAVPVAAALHSRRNRLSRRSLPDRGPGAARGVSG